MVAKLTAPPAVHPYSAGDWLTNTLNSRMAACGKSCRGSPVLPSLFQTPSTSSADPLVNAPAPMLELALRGRTASWFVPGIRSARSIGCRVASGSICICSCVMTPDTSTLAVSMIGASAVTDTDSCTPCSCMVTFCPSSLPTLRTMSVTSTAPKPCNSAFSFVPARRQSARRGNGRPPRSTTVRVSPVSVLRSVSVTPGSTPPCASLTIPAIAPLVVCAAARVDEPKLTNAAGRSTPPTEDAAVPGHRLETYRPPPG